VSSFLKPRVPKRFDNKMHDDSSDAESSVHSRKGKTPAGRGSLMFTP